MGIHAKYYWMAVTPDELEIPLYVAENKKELADYLGVTESTIATAEFRKRKGTICGYKIVKVRKE